MPIFVDISAHTIKGQNNTYTDIGVSIGQIYQLFDTYVLSNPTRQSGSSCFGFVQDQGDFQGQWMIDKSSV